LIPQLKLCDFGISRIQTTENISGTPYYIAPEILHASKTGTTPTHKETISADIWAIGLIILFCITPHSVRCPDNLPKTITKHCVDIPLQSVIRKCLETDLDIRISIDIVVKELLALITNQ